MESPAKSKTITSYLGKNFKVMASFGHIRDLPSKQGSVNTEKNFEMEYQISDGSNKTVAELVKEIKNADILYLATDPDREGEAISWHVLEILKQKKALPREVKRITFNQITKSAVLHAVANPREIDYHLVDAQQARLALDYLMGFNISPVLWRKLPGSKSAGRVQSVALRIVCEKEKEIKAFKTQEYWSIEAQFEINQQKVPAILEIFNGEKLEKFSIINSKQAEEIVKTLENNTFTVQDITKKETKRKPYAPFTTSTLQQEGSSKLYFSPKKTMQVAQGLYEGVSINGETKGLITYMRTDSISISTEGITQIRNYISKNLGEKYLPEKPIFYTSKQKNAQEAHEAIRPTDASLTPAQAKKFLKEDQFKLYDLIWKRSIASQMENAIFEATKATITHQNHEFKATGSIIIFDGFLKIYNYSSSEENILPKLNEGEKAKPIEILPHQHFTQAPARYTEATLIKQLEEKGIGRPSTYASIISVIQERGYVKMNEQKRLEPELRGRVVNSFLERFFNKYVEYDFTAHLEEDLDLIAEGKETKLDFLKKFWKPFHQNTEEVMQKQYEEIIQCLNEDLASVVFKINDDGILQNDCPSCKTGKLSLKLGKFGIFGSCSNYPECKYILNINAEQSQESQTIVTQEGKLIGNSENKDYFLKKGPYGLYIEISSPSEKKPKRIAIPKSINTDEIKIELAQKLESLPRLIGKHPEDGLVINAGIGPYGPYIVHNKKYVSIKTIQEVFEITVDEACQKIAESLLKTKKTTRKTVKTTVKKKKTKE